MRFRLVFITFAIMTGCGPPPSNDVRTSAPQLSTRKNTQPKPAPLRAEICLVDEQQRSWLRNKVRVIIKNDGEETVQILEPLDGALWSWYLPFYRFTVTDRSGNKMKMGARCGVSGLWTDTTWPDDYLVTLKPGEAFTKEFYLYHQIPNDGTYMVRFEYVMDPSQQRKSNLQYPDGLWHGVAASPEAALALEKQDI